jgi:hypothetical protein
MKNHYIAFAGLVVLIIAVGCKKNDAQLSQSEIVSNSVTTPQVSATTESGWNPSTDWISSKHADSTVYSTNIQTAAVTADAIQNGLVRIFKMNNNSEAPSTKLPFEEKAGAISQFWYYQVSEGNIMILIDVSGSNTNPAEKSLFKYVVLSGNAVKEIGKKGTSRGDLMSLSYDKLKELIK